MANLNGSRLWRHGLIIWLAMSLLGWTLYLAFQPRRSVLGNISRGWYSDHYSHMNASRAVLFGGVNV